MNRRMDTLTDPIGTASHMKKIICRFLFPAAFLVSGHAFSQEETAPRPVPVEIEKKDNTVLEGKLLGVERDSVLFSGRTGAYRIALKDIRNINYLDSLKTRRRWFEPPNRSRYLLSATAIPLRKGEIILTSTYLIIGSVQYGLTNRISVGAGLELFNKSIGFVNAKITLLENEKHRLSAAVNYYRLPSGFIDTYAGEEVTDLGMVTAASTWGTPDNHFTLGVGYIYLAGGFIPPAITLGGTARFAKNFAIVTENWFLFVGERTGIPVILSLGLRYLNKRNSIDLAFYNDHESPFDTYLPYLSYTIKIGRK